MKDMSLPVKAAVLGFLSSDTRLTALVPAERIYSMKPPVNPLVPFIRYGVPSIEPHEETCGLGSEVGVTINVVSHNEDEASRIAAMITVVMNDFSAPFRLLACDWVRTQIIEEDQDTFYVAVQYNIIATVET